MVPTNSPGRGARGLYDRARLVASSGVFRNALFNGLDHVLLPILWLLATPIFISRMGVDRFGIWMLINSLLGFSGLFSFGLSDATIKFVSHYRAVNDPFGVGRVIRSTLTVYLALGTFAAVVMGLAAPFLASRVFKVEARDAALLLVCLRVGSVGIVVRMFDSVVQSALQGFERYDITSTSSMATNIVTITANLTLAVLGFGLDVMLASSVAVLAVSVLCRLVAIKLMVMPALSFTPSFDPRTLKEIASFGLFSWLYGITSLVLSQADRLMIASMLGARQLVYFSVCIQVAQQVHSLPARVSTLLFPMVSAAKAVGDFDRLRAIYFRGMFLTSVAGIGVGVPLFMMSRSILTVWMGADFAAVATPVLQVLVFSYAVLSTSIVPYNYLMGTGYVRLNMILGFASGGLMVAASSFMIPRMGVTGAAWARLATIPVHVASWTIIHYTALDDRRWYVSLFVLGPVLATFGLASTLTGTLSSTVSRPDLLIALSLAWMVGGLAAGAGLSSLFLHDPKVLFAGKKL